MAQSVYGRATKATKSTPQAEVTTAPTAAALKAFAEAVDRAASLSELDELRPAALEEADRAGLYDEAARLVADIYPCDNHLAVIRWSDIAEGRVPDPIVKRSRVRRELHDLADRVARRASGANPPALSGKPGKAATFIRQFVTAHGRGPTGRQVADAAGYANEGAFNSNGARALRQAGFENRRPGWYPPTT